MPGYLIRSVILEGADALLRSHGQRPAVLARRAGLPPAALGDPDQRVPAAAVLRFFALASDAAGLPDFGLRLARNARLAALIGPLWVLLRNARSVRQLCDELVDNFDLYSDAALVGLTPLPGGRAALLSWSTTQGQELQELQMAEFSLAVLAAELRVRLGRDWQPQAVLFRHARPAGTLHLHRAVFGDDLRFNQDVNALLLDGDTLDTPLTPRSAAARALASRLVRIEEQRESPHAVAHNAEAVIRALMPYAPCTLAAVAEALGVAPRTLQLHLQREGTAFARLRDAVRADLAGKFLHDSRLGAAEIGEILGYADPTSFSRAFRRWNGNALRRMRRPGTKP